MKGAAIMSDDLKNEFENDNSQINSVNFVMRDAEDLEKTPANENVKKTEGPKMEEQKETAAASATENPIYARSYRKEAPKEEWYEQEKRKNYGDYQFTSPASEEQQKKKAKKVKKHGPGKKVASVVALAVVFGLVASVVFQATNMVGSRIFEDEKEQAQIASAKTADDMDKAEKDKTKNTKVNKDISGYTVADVAANAMSSIVAITGVSVQEIPNYFGFGSQQYEGRSSGSGIIVGQNDEELLIATNNHVVSGTNSLSVCFTGQDGNIVKSASKADKMSAGNNEELQEAMDNAVSAQVKGTDADNDLAVIAVKKEDIPDDMMKQIKVAVIGDSDALSIGDQVVAIGNALGYGQSLTSGYVSALNKQVNEEKAESTFIQTDAAINPGNSGGALLNMQGELIGINSEKIASNEVEGMGFAIPISRAQPILDELMSKETRYKVDEKKAAYIGITCLNVTAETNRMYDMPVGVFVDTLAKDGPADKAGIRRGDIITKMDGNSIDTYDGLVENLKYYEAGENVEFTVARANNGEYEEKNITVKLGAKSDIKE